MAELQGKDFLAVKELTTRDGLVARVGESCDFVPVESLAGLLRDGRIRPKPAAIVSAKKAEQ